MISLIKFSKSSLYLDILYIQNASWYVVIMRVM